MTSEDICFKPALELARLVREKALSPVEITDAFLVRIEALDPRLNAYLTVAGDYARAAALRAEQAIAAGNPIGPLHGVPFSIKDLVFTAGIRTTGGSRVYEDFVPEHDSIVVKRLKEAGGILLGKTSTPEFGHKGTTENLIIGDTRNPWALDKTPGGSSGGAGAATAAGLSPLSIGTDAGGSIRVPASFSGVFGFKPTFGRVPDFPGFGGGRTLSQTGPMTCTVADAALMLDVIAHPAEAARSSLPAHETTYLASIGAIPVSLRVGFSPDLGYAPVDAQVADIVRQAVSAFEDIGWAVEESHPGFDDPNEIFNTVIRAENYAVARPLLERHADLLDPGMRAFTENGATVTAQDYLLAQAERDRIAGTLADYFDRHDVLVTPTLAVPPFEIHTRPQQIAGRAIHGVSWIAFTYPFNLTGNPAASVPCGFTRDGLPVGMQVVGPRHADALVLKVCAAFEQARPWIDHRPGMT